MVSLELRESAVTDRADVVFPVAPVVEKAGTFLDWEGRAAAVRRRRSSRRGALADHRVLDRLADELGVALGTADRRRARAEIEGARLLGRRASGALATRRRRRRPSSTAGEAVLATWHLLLDEGALQDGEPHLAGTARPSVARLSAATAAAVGVADG